MAAFRKRGKRWQAIIRKSVQMHVVMTFPSMEQAEIWARGVETDMDRQAWEDLTLTKEKTVDDVIAAMHVQYNAGKGQQKAHNNLSKDLGTGTLSHPTAPVIADFGRLRAMPTTVMLDLSSLQVLVEFARNSMKLPANVENVGDARQILKDERIAGKPKERDRKPANDELNKLRDYRTTPKVERISTILMWTVAQFAIHTAMRIGKIIT